MGTVALLTDFGNKDGYVASMKAVIQGMSSRAAIIDISHEISPQNVAEARYVLWTVYRYFPAKTIFVCVVDTGVGTKRKIIAVKTRDYIFLVPDNGLLDMVLAECDNRQAFQLKNRKYFLREISSSFHGRDIFSPVASYLLNGAKLKSFGPAITLKKPGNVFQTISGNGEYNGTIIYVDRFGNLITNIRLDKIKHATLRINNHEISLQRTYADVKEGQLTALIGSSGLIEIAARNKNAGLLLRAGYETSVKLKVK